LATRSVPSAPAGSLASVIRRPGLAAAATVPFLFFHARWQTIHVGSSSFEVADVAVLVAVVVAARIALQEGFAPLRRAVPVLAAVGAFLIWIGITTLHPLLWQDGYAFHAHAITAAKFALWALLVAALPFLLHDRRDRNLLFGTLAVWALAATVVALLQFFGVSIFRAWPAGRRQPSFLEPNDFSVLANLALVAGLAELAFGVRLFGERRLAVVATAAGAVGAVLGGASSGALGAWLGFAGAVALTAGVRTFVVRRAAAAAAVLAITTLGVLAVRGRDFDDFLRFLGIKVETRASAVEVQTYTQRTILAYIGGRIFLAHPIVGAGWQGSTQPRIYQPFVADAKRKFPNKPALDFPSPGRPWGVQSGWIQSAADMGVVGFLLFAAMFVAGCVVAWRRRVVAGVALALLAAGMWLAAGLFAGVPIDALTWLALGLVAAGDG